MNRVASGKPRHPLAQGGTIARSEPFHQPQFLAHEIDDHAEHRVVGREFLHRRLVDAVVEFPDVGTLTSLLDGEAHGVGREDHPLPRLDHPRSPELGERLLAHR